MQQGRSHHLKLDWQGQARQILLHEPPGAVERELPLVLALHGTGGTGRLMAAFSGLNRLADERGFRVAYPSALGETGTEDPARGAAWNAGPGLGYAGQAGQAGQAGVDDVAFLSAVLDQMGRQAPVDPRRVFMAGFSNGARMAYRLALEAPWVAAIAAVAGAPVWGPAPVRPVPTLAFHGTEDRHIPYGGGVGSQGRRIPALPAPEAAARWAALMGCDEGPARDSLEAHTLDTWSGAGCEVGLWTVQGMGHAWPGGRRYGPDADLPAKDLSASHLIWAFFEAHPLEVP